MRRTWRKLLFVLLLVLLLSGCRARADKTGYGPRPNVEAYQINAEIPCEQYDYSFIQGDGMTLTKIGRPGPNNQPEWLGSMILTDYTSYRTILDAALAREPDELQKTQSAFSPNGLTEEDFEQHDFLLVDAFFDHTELLYPRLGGVLVDEHEVLVLLQYDYWDRASNDGYGCGVLYFIPIPKHCMEAVVLPIHASFAG